jgi:hypothetical protein
MSGIRVVALRSRLRGAPVVGAVVAALALGGCSGDPVDAADRPTSTPSGPVTSPSPSGTPATGDSGPPDVPPARADAASRKEFASVVVDSWSHALQTNRARSVTRLTNGGSCQGCAELRRELAGRKKEGWYVDFPGAEVGRTKVRPGGPSGTWVARVKVDIPASRSYFDDGTFRNDNEAHGNATFEVSMRKDGKRWRLLGFRVVT